MIPMMPHMGSSEEGRSGFLGALRSRGARLEFGTKRRRPPLLCDLTGAPESHGAGRDVVGDDAAGRDVRPGADAYRRDQGAVRADERLAPDHRAPLAVTIVVHGDGAG